MPDDQLVDDHHAAVCDAVPGRVVSGLAYREPRATRNRANAAQVVTIWSQLMLK